MMALFALIHSDVNNPTMRGSHQAAHTQSDTDTTSMSLAGSLSRLRSADIVHHWARLGRI